MATAAQRGVSAEPLAGLLAIIEDLKAEYGSINAAARAMMMPQATLHAIYNGEEPKLKSLRLIADHRKQPLWELVREIEARG